MSGPYQPGSAYSLQFATSNPTSGVAQDADLLPVATAVHNGLDDPAFVLVVVHRGTGFYSASGMIPAGYVAFDSVAIRVAATVAGVAGVAIVDLFAIASNSEGPTYTRTKTAPFGPSYTGLTGIVGYTLYNPNGTVNTARIRDGIVECPAGSGNYIAVITFPSGFSGLLAWDTGVGPPHFIVEEINPGADEYLNATISSRSTYTGGAVASVTAPVTLAAVERSAVGTAVWADGSRTLTDKTGFGMAPNGLDTVIIEPGFNLPQALSLIGAVNAGDISGQNTNHPIVRAMGNDAVRIDARTDTAGNRTSVILTPPP